MSEKLREAAYVLADCLEAGDNAEYTLSTVAADYGVNPEELAKEFRERFGVSYLSYASED